MPIWVCQEGIFNDMLPTFEMEGRWVDGEEETRGSAECLGLTGFWEGVLDRRAG